MNTNAASLNLALALVHNPVYNKHREIVTTSVTNLDIHDISRAARTYGISRYYIVTPSPDQQDMVRRIVGHWKDGWGSTYNPDRSEALGIISIVSTVNQAATDFQFNFVSPVTTVATGARPRPSDITYQTLRNRLRTPDSPHMLIMGTGWGLADEIFANSTNTLEPILAVGDYNHLSVRSATAIMLDRLIGEQN